jgi:hypothetical protein
MDKDTQFFRVCQYFIATGLDPGFPFDIPMDTRHYLPKNMVIGGRADATKGELLPISLFLTNRRQYAHSI